MEDLAFTALETDRLVIRRFCEADAGPLAAYRDDPEVARYQGWDRPYSTREASDFIASLRDLAPGRPGTWFQFAVGPSGSSDLIGDVALRTTSEDPTAAELGFSFAVAHQGRGCAAEAVGAVIDYAFTDLGMRRIFAITEPRNERAQRLLRRLEFRLEQRISESALLYGRFGFERRSTPDGSHQIDRAGR